MSSCTQLVFWDLSCSEQQEIQKHAFLTYFYCFYNSLAIIYQKGCMSGLVGDPSISVLPSECLFGRFQVDLGFWLKT